MVKINLNINPDRAYYLINEVVTFDFDIKLNKDNPTYQPGYEYVICIGDSEGIKECDVISRTLKPETYLSDAKPRVKGYIKARCLGGSPYMFIYVYRFSKTKETGYKPFHMDRYIDRALDLFITGQGQYLRNKKIPHTEDYSDVLTYTSKIEEIAKQPGNRKLSDFDQKPAGDVLSSPLDMMRSNTDSLPIVKVKYCYAFPPPEITDKEISDCYIDIELDTSSPIYKKGYKYIVYIDFKRDLRGFDLVTTNLQNYNFLSDTKPHISGKIRTKLTCKPAQGGDINLHVIRLSKKNPRFKLYKTDYYYDIFQHILLTDTYFLRLNYQREKNELIKDSVKYDSSIRD